MRKSRILLVVLALAVITACAANDRGKGLLELMPEGYDIYFTFNPEGIGINSILSELATSPLIRDADLDQVREALGFHPLDWSEWAETLALKPGREIGFIVDSGDNDVALVCIYVPSSDHESVKEFFTRVLEYSGEFRGELEFREMEDYSIVIIAETEDIAACFDPAADNALGSDRDLSRLTGDHSDGESDASIYICFADMIDDSLLHSALLEMKIEGSELEIRLAGFSTNHDVIRYSSILASSPSGINFGIPDDATSVLCLTLEMETLKGLVLESGIDREFQAGIEDSGFPSIIDFMEAFSGDVCLSYGSGDDQYSIALQLGLNDPQAITNLLTLIRGIVIGTEGSGMTEFDLNGEICYRIEAHVAPGIDSMEFGGVNGTLMIAGGWSLLELVNGKVLEDYTREHGMGIGSEHGIVFTSSMEVLNDVLGIRTGAADTGDGEAMGLSRVACSLDADGGLLELVILLDVTVWDPFLIALQLFSILGS